MINAVKSLREVYKANSKVLSGRVEMRRPVMDHVEEAIRC